MRKTKKQLLGLICLAAVALMTVLAMSLPAPEASAAEEGEQNNGKDNSTQVQVTVFEDNKASVRIQSPRNGEQFTTNVIPVSVLYTRANKIELTYKDSKGLEQKKVYEIAPENFESGVYNTEIVLDDYITEPTTLTATIYGNNGTTLQDFVQFSYRAVATEMGDTNTENGNPSVDVKVDETVEDLQVCVYDKDGKPVFASKEDPDNGCVNIKLDDIDKGTGEFEVTMPDGSVVKGTYDPETGDIHVEVPMDQSGAGEGDYTVVIIGKDENGNPVSLNQNSFHYRPVTPELPNTGSIFGGLNISQADYLVTGLIAFSIAAGFAMLLIFRRNHRN